MYSVEDLPDAPFTYISILQTCMVPPVVDGIEGHPKIFQPEVTVLVMTEWLKKQIEGEAFTVFENFSILPLHLQKEIAEKDSEADAESSMQRAAVEKAEDKVISRQTAIATAVHQLVGNRDAWLESGKPIVKSVQAVLSQTGVEFAPGDVTRAEINQATGEFIWTPDAVDDDDDDVFGDNEPDPQD